LTQVILKPTYKDNTLDLVLTDAPNRIQDVEFHAPLGVTNQNQLHAAITWNLFLKDGLDAQSPRFTLNFKKANFERIASYFHDLSCAPIENDVNMSYSSWLSHYHCATRQHIPLIWVNTGESGLNYEHKNNLEMKETIKNKHTYFAKSRAGPKNHLLKAKYKETKLVKTLTYKFRCEFERKIASVSKLNPKRLYSYINSQKSSKDQIRMLKEEERVLVNNIDIANCLNKAFHSVFNNETRRSEMPTFRKRCEISCDSGLDFLS
jgi:hypothetical protein